MSRYLAIPGARMRVVPLGVDVDRFRPGPDRPAGPLTIGYFGRIAPEKGVHRLCDAYAALRGRGGLAGCRVELGGLPRVRSTPVTGGRSRAGTPAGGWPGTSTTGGELALDDKVSFLQALDLFVVPAEYDDPKGLSLIEAMACGVPVVAPRRGTYTELIERTGGGVLVEPEDSAAIERVLAALAADPERRAELGRRAAEGCGRATAPTR